MEWWYEYFLPLKEYRFNLVRKRFDYSVEIRIDIWLSVQITSQLFCFEEVIRFADFLVLLSQT